MLGPNPNDIHPNPNIPSVCYIKNTITRPTIIVGDYTYYDDPIDSKHFELHVTHHYDFIGDKLIIGKFCAIGKGVEFIMNGVNHRMCSVSTYPFNIMGGGWEKSTPPMHDLPLKGDIQLPFLSFDLHVPILPFAVDCFDTESVYSVK